MKRKLHKRKRKPQAGWRVVGYGDMEEVDPLHFEEARCDQCGRALRFVNVLSHPDWPNDIFAGNVCGERLTAAK